MEKWYVGVDGGGTKTAFAIAGADHVPVYTVEYPTCSYQSIGVEAAMELVRAGVLDCLSAVGVSLTECAGVCVGMPCYGENREKDAEILRRANELFAAIPVYVVNDGEVGWAGSLACQEGINIVSGTGSIAFGRGKDHAFARCGGWVQFFGDEGSCYWIGRETMSLFSKEADGRMPRGALYDIVREAFGLDDDYEIIDIVLSELAPHRERVASFQRYALQAAQAGDQAVIALYERAADELAGMIHALKQKLRFSSEPITVSYSGGLFHAGEFILSPLREKVEQMGGVLQTPKASALEGALMLAIEKFGR